jgi:hypothetical protein
LTKKKIVWFPGKFKNAKVSSIFKKMIGNFCIFFAGEKFQLFFFSVNFFRQKSVIILKRRSRLCSKHGVKIFETEMLNLMEN